ncbi:hypothetical protein CNMCM6457_004592 [Aspergillus fumigatiaffinis]|nr:hypothetical protein CNMCM6457_004592 [Aspergillus fumigatiaffinis]
MSSRKLQPIYHQDRISKQRKVLYSTKSAKKEYYPVPEALTTIGVFEILHNHTLVANTFWPLDAEVVEEEHTSQSTTEFVIRSSAGRATMSTIAEGIFYEEEMPLGFKMAIIYKVADVQDKTGRKTLKFRLVQHH